MNDIPSIVVAIIFDCYPIEYFLLNCLQFRHSSRMGRRDRQGSGNTGSIKLCPTHLYLLMLPETRTENI
jgi:hypothetical protein